VQTQINKQSWRTQATERDEAVTRYKSGESVRQIAASLSVSTSSVYYWLWKRGVITDSNRKLSIADKKIIVQQYKNGASSGKIGPRFGVQGQTVLHVLREAEIDRRDSSEAHRLFHVWESAFDRLTEDSAYWIGFLMADGCVRGNKIVLCLNKKDAAHVKKFKRFLHSQHKIASHPNNAVRITVTSRQIVEALKGWGITERKSLTVLAHNELITNRHFWRGVIDGDGSFYYSNGGGPTITLRLTSGSSALLDQFKTYALSLGVGRCSIIPRKTAKAADAHIHGKNALLMLRTLYSRTRIALSRKKRRARAMLKRS
jgi:hypothetical protein